MSGADDAMACELRQMLRGEPDGIYLNTAAEGLWLASHDDAWREYADAKSSGSAGRSSLERIERETRELFAQSIGVDAANIAFVCSTSRGVDAAIKSVAWAAGDTLVTVDTEFPSTLFAAELLGSAGVEVIVVPYRDGAVHVDDVVAAIDERTRLVILSLVSFKTGQRLETPLITDAAHRHGALVFLDAVQGIGSIDYRVGAEDFVCAAGFKWLMGSHGAAALYASDRALALTSPPYVGYRSVVEIFPPRGAVPQLHADARRYEEGLPGFLSIAVLRNSLRVIQQLGQTRISAHNQALTQQLRAGLQNLGIRILCPDERVSRGSITAFETQAHDELERALREERTIVWARDGRIRISPHAYNTSDEIDRFLEHMAGLSVVQP
jgi:selenocysteine lyase/cysteine desulfurase